MHGLLNKMISNNRTAIILCGGKGTRLGLLGKKKAKTLIKIQNREILWYIINLLKSKNFNHFVIPLGFKGSQIKSFFKKYKNFNTQIDLIETGINTDIGKRIAMVLDQVKSDNFLLLNGDAIFDLDLDKIYKFHNQKKSLITFLLGEITYQYGTVGIKNNKIKDFKRNLVYEAIKIRNSNSYLAYNYTGMSIINKKILYKFYNLINNSKNFEQDIFPKIISTGKSNFYKIDSFWHSIDNIKDIKAANEHEINSDKYLKIKKIKKKLNEK